MAEVAFEGIYGDGSNPDDQWGIDGWSEGELFKILLTGEESGGIAYLTTEHCSKLAAALIEHIKEVSDATEEDVA